MADPRDRDRGARAGADLPLTDDPAAWSPIESELVGDYERFKVRRTRSRSPQNGEAFDYYILDMPDWVNVVPVTEDGRLVLAEQYRHGKRELSLEFPSGTIEPGEDACAAGERELEEETGYVAARSELIGTVDPNTALQTNELRIVLAEGCTPTGDTSQDRREDVRVRLVEPDDLPELTSNGGIHHALAIATWYCYRRWRRDDRS